MGTPDHNNASLEAKIERLKHRYSQELRESPDNPMKICMKLVFESATERDAKKQLDLAEALSRFLTQPEGVINLFLALIDFDSSSQRTTTHNQRFIAVSNIITCLPKICMPYTNYCENISHQLWPLLISDNYKYSALACIIFKAMIESPHAKCGRITEILLGPIFSPFTSTEADIRLHDAIIAIHNLLLNHLPIELFVTIFPNLFHILVQLFETPSQLKSSLQETLVSILNGLKPGPACCLLEQTLFYQDGVPIYERNNEESEFSIKIQSRTEKDNNDTRKNQVNSHIIQLVIKSLIESSKNDLLILEFFFHFKETMWSAKDSECRQLSAFIIEPLLSQTVEEKSSNLDLLTIIATNTDRTVDLLLRILLNYITYLKCNPQDDLDQKIYINQSISSCFNILEVLYATVEGEKHKKLLADRCTPILKELNTLLVIEKDETNKELFEALKTLYSKIKNTSHATKDSSTDEGCSPDQQEYLTILKDLNDKLVPVRVHALVKLKHMILVNDRFTVSQIPQLYSMIEHTLADQEPYVFLACINLMSEMVVRKTGEILPKLVELYSSKELDLQHRMNIGEVLAKLSKQMNQTAPFYAPQVMNILFSACKDEEELMRASSLTNIGQICQNLGHSLSNYVIQIMQCIESVLISNDTILVKCAAIELLKTALMGLDKFKVESIQRELKSIYSMLKKVKHKTLDEKFCLQVDLALDELDRIAKEMLSFDVQRNNEDKILKNIKLLSLLD